MLNTYKTLNKYNHVNATYVALFNAISILCASIWWGIELRVYAISFAICAYILSVMPRLIEKNHLIAQGINIIGAYFFLGSIAFTDGGFSSNTIHGLWLIPLSSITFFDRRYLYPTTIVTILMYILIFFLDLNQRIPDLTPSAYRVIWDPLAVSLMGVFLIIALNNYIKAKNQLMQENANLIVQLEESLATKDVFLANMSHELRTPLNGIYGVLQVLSMKLDDTKLKDLVSAAKQSSEGLNRIVSDILDIQKMSNGKLDISPDWIETTKVFEQIERLHKNTANLKGISFEVYINQNTPDELYCDELRINQILNNLIGNSLKFTHAGSVKLSIDYQDFLLCLTVADTGIGMDDIAIEHLFDRFTQADSSISKKYAGTGLGMAICKELVTLMNGSINVDSTPDQGTTFIVKLPLQGKNKISKKPFSMQTEQATQSLIRVLLVDDSEMNLISGKELLELKYDIVETANNGKEALAKLANEHFDIVISDIQMPNMSGEELLTRIIATYPHLPCIALTGNATEANTHRFLKLGFKAVVSKPFNLEHLIQVIENILVE